MVQFAGSGDDEEDTDWLPPVQLSSATVAPTHSRTRSAAAAEDSAEDPTHDIDTGAHFEPRKTRARSRLPSARQVQARDDGKRRRTGVTKQPVRAKERENGVREPTQTEGKRKRSQSGSHSKRDDAAPKHAHVPQQPVRQKESGPGVVSRGGKHARSSRK